MKILRNEEYDKLINDKTPTIEYYMNNPYQARKIEKLEDYNIELEIKIDKKDKEIERLKNNWTELRKWIVNNKHNENTEERYLVVDYGTLLGKMSELKGSDKE